VEFIISRKVTFEEGIKFAKENGLIFMEVSAKTAYQVDEAFKRNADLLLGKIEKGIINVKNDVHTFIPLASWNQSGHPT
jgi:Ras-related protein Rab-2A